MRYVSSVCLLAVAGVTAVPVAAAGSNAPVLSLMCGRSAVAKLSACTISGRGFRAAERLNVTYSWVVGTQRNVVLRHARTTSSGIFSRPVLKLALGRNYAVNAEVRGPTDPAAHISLGGTGSAILGWMCGSSDPGGTVHCALSGRGFAPGESIRLSYDNYYVAPGRTIAHENIQRQVRADGLGTFIRPHVNLHFGLCYRLVIDAVARSGLEDVATDSNFKSVQRGCM